MLLVLVLGAAGAYALIKDRKSGSAATAGTPSPADPNASPGAHAGEQCTAAIKANPRWVCLTSAVVKNGTLTVHYQVDYHGSTPDNVNGYHLHIYGGDGVTPPDSVEGKQSLTPGHWYVEDHNPSVRSVTGGDYRKAIGTATKVCARISDSDGLLVQDQSGTFVTGNCVPIKHA